jgi:anti-sigma regulatory factor (Ser/Thr protein kinase)/GNAT superfamily N-acetyltransferase
MPPGFRTELTLPADARIQQLVHNYGRSLAVLADFSEDQAEPLAQALWEACKNSLEYAFDDDESGLITLVGELTPKALTLAVRDRGVPFDQTLDPESLPAAPESFCPRPRRGRGLALIHQCADEVRWINLGLDGKELRFTKYRSGICLIEPPPASAANPHLTAVSQEAPQHYTIRLLRPEDAIRVAQLMYRVYGYSYSNADFYYPERLDHDLKTGTHVGVVAVAEDGEIVGHVGVMRPNAGPLAELGQLAVAPAHRGQGLRKLMGDRLAAAIQGLGLVGLYAEAVTIHTISQEASDSRGLHVTGLKLLDWQAHFKKLRSHDPEPGSQRENMVYYFKYLTPPVPAKVCAPSRHRQVLDRIYENLEAPREYLEPSGSLGHGQLTVHYDRETGAGTIQVNRIGIDTLPEIEQAQRDLCDMAGAAVVGLNLPLAQGTTPYLADAAEACGFFFSGVLPHSAPDGDFLRLQYLNAPLDLERLHLSSPFARELLAYILEDKERVEQKRGTTL